MKKILCLLTSILLLVTVFSGCQQTSAPEISPSASPTPTVSPASVGNTDDFTVGFVFVGSIKDGGWTTAHYNALLEVKEQLGVNTIYKENVPESAGECEQVIRDMIDEGAKIIFTTSFGFMDDTAKVAAEFPDVKFLHCSGYTMADNMSKYFGRIYQARYLSGIVAGLKTETNKIGYVAAFDIPEVVRGINAFTLGVRSVNPEAQVIVRWTNTWYDPAKEKDAAIALLDEEGVDVMAQHQDTTAPQLAAEEKGAFAIGYNTDTATVAPKAYLTAPLWNWGPYYIKQIEAAMNGTWKSEDYWKGMDDGIVTLAPLTDLVPAEAKAKVDELIPKIKDNSFEVFTGPIKDQTGAIKVADGTKMTDKELLEINWFVEGVEGKISANQ